MLGFDLAKHTKPNIEIQSQTDYFWLRTVVQIQ